MATRQVIVGSKAHEKPQDRASLEDGCRRSATRGRRPAPKMEEAMRAEKAGAAIREEKFKKLLEVAQGASR